MTTTNSYHVPTRPYSPIDAMNRRAAAQGSPTYAMGAAVANYNGHSVSVYFNDYRGYYVAEYHWGERCVLARGTFRQALTAALREFDRGALGASVSVSIPASDLEANEIAAGCLQLLSGPSPHSSDWYTWRHEVAASCAPDAALPGRTRMIFDWEPLQSATDRDDYQTKLKAKHGRIY